MFYIILESGGSEVNTAHEPYLPRGGITSEMQVYSRDGSYEVATHTTYTIRIYKPCLLSHTSYALMLYCYEWH